jgi:hypothetical protein
MDDADQIPGPVHIFKHQSQASPIHPGILRVKPGEMKLDKNTGGIGLCNVINRIPCADFHIVSDHMGIRIILIIHKSIIVIVEV